MTSGRERTNSRGCSKAAPERGAIVGVDFGAPRWVRDQRRKIIAISARPTARRSYRIDASGLNARLLSDDAPGFGAQELVDALVAQPARVVGFDFPFCVPDALLRDARFAVDVGHERGAFLGWHAFNRWVAQRLPLTDPLDFTPFARWRDPAERTRLWARRATDVACGAQPPLKDRFQATFQMTLLGNAVLARLCDAGSYRVQPFAGDGDGELIEVYPGATLRTCGLGSYKARPDDAVRAGVDLCAAAGIEVDVDHRIVERARHYSSGSATSPDHDVADAFVALCTAILHAEGACRPALPPAAGSPAEVVRQQRLHEREGAIWVPMSTASAPRTRQTAPRDGGPPGR